MTRVIDEINKVIDSLNTNIKYTTNNKYVEKETVKLQIEDVNENNIKEKLSTLSTTNQEVKQEIIENINNDILSLNVDELGNYIISNYEVIENIVSDSFIDNVNKFLNITKENDKYYIKPVGKGLSGYYGTKLEIKKLVRTK